MADVEKDPNGNGYGLEKTVSKESHLSSDERINVFTPVEQKKIIRRIDIRLVVTLGLMYCVSLMDRTNLGIVAISGMAVDLETYIGFRYSTIVLVFFVTYVILQPFATVVLRKVGPRIFLPAIVILWGVTMMVFGFLTSWTQMVGLRLVLGVFEAGFFPGAAFLLSCWYPRFDLQKRNAVFYLIGTMASAFAGILAYGFSHMNGLGDLGPTWGQHVIPTLEEPDVVPHVEPGIAGWRWIFIMEGLLTILVGALSLLTIADFPEQAAARSTCAIPFLNKKEADFIVARIEKDRHDVVALPFSFSHYMKCAADLKIWGFAWLFGLTTTCTYAIAYFLPIILEQGMGFSVGAAQCLVAPPYVAGGLWMYFCAYMADKQRMRGPWIIANGVICIIGLATLGFASNVGARYFGVFLATGACNANVPCILTYQANNIRGQWKRALASATLVGAGGVGGIIGSTVFRSQDAPEYIPGIIACLIACGMVIAIVCALDVKFWYANKRVDKGGKPIEGLEGFKYTY